MPSSSLYSPLPITHVSATPGQARRSVRTSGTTWVASPSADSRSRQIVAGATAWEGAGITGLEGMRLLDRSEEHTSELQSLMRISYAVFCLKKKQQQHSYNS